MVLDERFRRELSLIVGEKYVIDSGATPQAYTHDNSPFPPVPACTVGQPSSTEEISSILRLANEFRIKVLVRGRGFSLTGLVPSDPKRTIIVETTRLNHIRTIDEENMVVRVEGGTIMSDLEKDLGKRGMYVHTVTVPINHVTVGGVLSGVVGGGLGPRRPLYGTGVNFVLGLKVVLPSGQVLHTGAGGSNIHQAVDYVKGGNGPDILGLFIGDSGIFGIKVEATMQMFPEPVLKQGECRIFKNFQESWRALSVLESLETLPFTQLRVVDRGADYSFEYVVEATRREILELSLDTIAQICRENGGSEGSKQDQEYARTLPNLSGLRSEAFINQPRYFIAFISGRKEFPVVYSEIKNFILNEIASKRLGEVGVSVQMAFQPTMRNSIFCTFNVAYDPKIDKSRSGILSMGNQSYEKLIKMGCCPQPHQGFGAEMMARYWSDEYKQVMFGIKKLLDPNMILNSNLWGLS